MRTLFINDQLVDIDDETVIGLNFQAYDIKEIGQRKLNISNQCTIPATSNNLKIFDFAGNPHQIGASSWEDVMSCNYYIDNDILIENGQVILDEVSNRISITLVQNKSIWDVLKTTEFSWGEIFSYLITFKGLPYIAEPSPFICDPTGDADLIFFLNEYRDATEGVKLSFFHSNFFNLDYLNDRPDENFAYEENTKICLNDYLLTSYGAHFSIFAKTIFEFLEWKYSVNFGTAGGYFDNNIWDDDYGKAIHTPWRSLVLTNNNDRELYFKVADETTVYTPLKVGVNESATWYDFVNAFFQHFNIVIDEFKVNDELIYRLARFDDITTQTPIDFSGIAGKPKFKAKVDNTGQNNFIRFKSVYEGGSKNANCKKIVCNNKNLEAESTLFEIQAFVPSVTNIGVGKNILDLSTDGSFKDFVFLIDSAEVEEITVEYWEQSTSDPRTIEEDWRRVFQADYPIAALYSLQGEYTLIESALAIPKFYEIEKWLTLKDLRGLKFFNQYFIKELNGCFYINKISGFNPQKSNSPTKLEVLKISDEYTLTTTGEGIGSMIIGTNFIVE